METAPKAMATHVPPLLRQGAFFFGFVEVSSLPLVFVDLFRQFPRLHEGSPAGTRDWKSVV